LITTTTCPTIQNAVEISVHPEIGNRKVAVTLTAVIDYNNDMPYYTICS